MKKLIPVIATILPFAVVYTTMANVSSHNGQVDNRYLAPKAEVAPVLDGQMDPIWEKAPWDQLDVTWQVGTHHETPPSSDDFSGRYKVLWDANYVYMLYDIQDDVLHDASENPLERFWEDDTVEIFLDENRSGGDHNSLNTFAQAFAYHISIFGDNVDSVDETGAQLLNDHVESVRISQGTTHMWEMRMRIYDDNYTHNKPVQPVTLNAGKLMGFTASYIDNDGGNSREHMIGSVNSEGHMKNQGYLNADGFGELLLVE